MTIKQILSASLLFGLLSLPMKNSHAEAGSWGFGADLGVLTGTVEGGAFAVGLNADRYIHRVTSLGFLGFVTPSSDLFSVSGAGVLKFHIELEKVTVSPLIGVGAIFQDVERDVNNVTVEDDDTSYWIPIGVSVEHPFNENLTGGVKVILNLHDLEFKKPFGDDSRSAYITGALHFRP